MTGRAGIIAALVTVALATLAIWPACQPAGANISAPKTVRSPSGALRPARPGSLTVLAEELSFSCAQDCLIEAVYRIQAQSGGRFAFSFILPQPHPVSVQVNGQAQEAATEPFTWQPPAGKGPSPRLYQAVKMARASFQARLEPGRNTIRVSYRHNWGLEQLVFGGYFSGWQSTKEVDYELWPLKDWRLAKNFRLRIRVQVTETLAAQNRVLLRAFDRPQGPGRDLFLAPRPRSYAPLSFELDLEAAFPDRLRLLLGPAEVLGLKPEPENLGSADQSLGR